MLFYVHSFVIASPFFYPHHFFLVLFTVTHYTSSLYVCIDSFFIICYLCFCFCVLSVCFFFLKQKTAYEMRISDWSSDVCSSDLIPSISDASCRRWPISPMPRRGCLPKRAWRRDLSFRPAISAMALQPSTRERWARRSGRSCWRPTPTGRSAGGGPRVFTSRAPLSPPSPTRWTSAPRAISSGCPLPQRACFARAAAGRFAEAGVAPGLIIPTGNLGHGFAAVYARAMGAPIGPIVLATNANRPLSRWRAEGVYQPGPSVATLANAMDVGAPSNFERLVHLPTHWRDVEVERVEDESIRARIRTDHEASGYVWCPHSATAAEAYVRLDAQRRAERPWVAAATAHPFKFADIVEPLVGRAIQAPPALAAIAGRMTRSRRLAPDLAALSSELGKEKVFTSIV